MDEQLELPGMGEQLAEKAVSAYGDNILDLDSARVITDLEVSMVKLVNGLGQEGEYAVLSLTSCDLGSFSDDSSEETTFVFLSSASLELTINLLKAAQGYTKDPEENTDNV